jgi:hypothetical protein
MVHKKAGDLMENCPKCNSLLRTGVSWMTFENDDTPDMPTIAYTNIPLFCLNKECENFAGENSDKPNYQPKYLVDVVKNRVN